METYEKAQEIGRPLTSRSDWPASSFGGLHMSVQTVRGLCPRGKCTLKAGHRQQCWPEIRPVTGEEG